MGHYKNLLNLRVFFFKTKLQSISANTPSRYSSKFCPVWRRSENCGNTFIMVTCEKFYFKSQIKNQHIYLKMILHNDILYERHLSYSRIYQSYFGMALMFTAFPQRNNLVRKSSNTWFPSIRQNLLMFLQGGIGYLLRGHWTPLLKDL